MSARDDGTFETDSGIPVAPLYGPGDAPADPERSLGDPGEFPFTRGVYPSMYRGRVWTMRFTFTQGAYALSVLAGGGAGGAAWALAHQQRRRELNEGLKSQRPHGGRYVSLFEGEESPLSDEEEEGTREVRGMLVAPSASERVKRALRDAGMEFVGLSEFGRDAKGSTEAKLTDF